MVVGEAGGAAVVMGNASWHQPCSWCSSRLVVSSRAMGRSERNESILCLLIKEKKREFNVIKPSYVYEIK